MSCSYTPFCDSLPPGKVWCDSSGPPAREGIKSEKENENKWGSIWEAEAQKICDWLQKRVSTPSWRERCATPEGVVQNFRIASLTHSSSALQTCYARRKRRNQTTCQYLATAVQTAFAFIYEVLGPWPMLYFIQESNVSAFRGCERRYSWNVYCCLCVFCWRPTQWFKLIC